LQKPSYFNELVGGPKGGPNHLLDSNIDWGQDLFYLKDWLNAHREVKLEGLAYCGLIPATLAGVPETRRPPTGAGEEGNNAVLNARRPRSTTDGKSGPRAGWYALSVNYIYGRDRQYRYFLNFEPVAMAGYSICIYHITLEDANRVRRELGLPEFRRE
jgi:hypothetical protein